jgi:hypothetical protein
MAYKNKNLVNEDGTPKRSPGRPKGAGNKVATTVKEALAMSFNNIGGVKWMEKLAEKEPRAYAQLLAKLIPTGVQAVGTDGESAPLQIKIVLEKPNSNKDEE